MGANQSQSNYKERASTSDPSGEQADALNSTDDLYTILKVNPDASSDEIKKAFRKQALIHHPDKNFENVEQATKNFAKIQQAYEILCDEDERAFYDRHRHELLNKDNDDDFDPTQIKPTVPRSSLNPGLTTKQILKFFDSTLWKGDFSDSSTSFFTIYRNLFHQLAVEEKIARHDTTIIYPSFGTSQSNYDEGQKETRALKSFYSTWANFSTQKSFEWVEPHRTNQPVDRRVKRLIEKENQRERENARREYNETVRSLVSFVKKRDPRFACSTASNPEKWRSQEIQRIKRELKEAAEKRAKQREEEAQQFREQAWQRQRDQGENEDLETVDAQTDSAAEDHPEHELPEFAPNDWYCAACGKQFNSQGAWENHERSKKHRQNAQRLRKKMLEEDAQLSLFTSVSSTVVFKSEDQSNVPEIVEKQQETQNAEIGTSCINAQFANLNLDASSIPNTATTNRPLRSDKSESDLGCRDPINSLQSQSHHLANLDEQNHQKQTYVNSKDGSETEAIPVVAAIEERKAERPAMSVSVTSSGTRIATNLNEEDDGTIHEQCLKGSLLTTLSTLQSGSISKKDKRRAKEAAKKLMSRKTGEVLSCNVCDATFDSKNKLFEHIKQYGHALAVSQSASSNEVGSTSITRKQIHNKPKSRNKKPHHRGD